VPHGAEPDALHQAQSFVERLRAIPMVMNDDGSEHDRVMAAVSHLPQIVASALMALAADAAGTRLAWAGSGLRDTTRLAASSSELWRSVLASNADELGPLLRTFAEQLVQFAEQLDDPIAVGRLFERANAARAILEKGNG
jgi:prephenate dehydrogenase